MKRKQTSCSQKETSLYQTFKVSAEDRAATGKNEGSEMKLLKAIQEFEITLSGGFALYALYCMLFVTLLGIIQTLNWLFR